MPCFKWDPAWTWVKVGTPLASSRRVKNPESSRSIKSHISLTKGNIPDNKYNQSDAWAQGISVLFSSIVNLYHICSWLVKNQIKHLERIVRAVASLRFCVEWMMVWRWWTKTSFCPPCPRSLQLEASPGFVPSQATQDTFLWQYFFLISSSSGDM